MKLDKIRKIAVIGASANREKYGNIILRYLLSKGYEVYPVNPKYEEIEGVKCYKNVEELPKDVEILVFVLPPEKGIEVVRKALELGFKNFWFQPGAENEKIKNFLKGKNVVAFFGKCVMREIEKVKE